MLSCVMMCAKNGLRDCGLCYWCAAFLVFFGAYGSVYLQFTAVTSCLRWKLFFFFMSSSLELVFCSASVRSEGRPSSAAAVL